MGYLRKILIWVLVFCLIVVFSILFATYLVKNAAKTPADTVIEKAMEQLDVEYILNSREPFVALDCSALVSYAFSFADVELVPYAQTIGYDNRFERIKNIDELERGDIVCFDTVKDNDKCDHVGIYLGKNRFVHASSKAGKVTVSELIDYYLDTFSWGIRVFER